MPFRLLFFLILLCYSTGVTAQLDLSKRLEVEGGMSYTFGVNANDPYQLDDFSYRGGVGYQVNLNAHLSQRFFGMGYRFSTFFGIGYGSGRGTFEDLSLRQEELTSLLSSAPEVVRSQETTLETTYQFFSVNFGLRAEVSERFAVLITPQIRINRGGSLNYQSRVTTNFLYDFSRNQYIRLDEPFVTSGNRKTQRNTHASILLGAEYRTFNERMYTKLLFDFGGPDSRFPFSTFGLQLLLGTRI